MWEVTGAGVGPGDTTRLRLSLSDSATTRELWPHAFQLDLVVTVGPRLEVELIAHNPGDQPYVCGGALHTYFGVGDVTRIAIQGLDGCDYLDKVESFQRKTQQGPITISGETDRIYLDTTSACTIDDPSLKRRVQITKAGSRTTVVWNPWSEKARQLADFGDEEYRDMVCVETANADQDVVTVAPGGEHRLSAVIGVDG
jgi:D-hexose-6-phosphate mutarotase